MMAEDGNSRRGLLFLLVLVIGGSGWFVFKWWTRPMAVEFDNLKYIQLLMTAVSSRNPEQLEKVDASITHQFDAGEMSEKELQTFRRIVAQAREGQWEEAYQASFRLAEAQLGRRRTRPPSQEHTHSHEHGHGHKEHGN